MGFPNDETSIASSFVVKIAATFLVASFVYFIAFCIGWNNRSYLRRRWRLDAKHLKAKEPPKTTSVIKERESIGAKLTKVRSEGDLLIRQYQNECVVIMKVKTTTCDPAFVESLVVLQDIAKIAGFSNSNERLAKLFGYTFHEFLGFSLVFKLGYGSPLKRMLKNVKLAVDLKYSLIRDLAMAMEMLHCSFLKVHGDLRTSSCLVDERFVLRIMITRLPQITVLNKKLGSDQERKTVTSPAAVPSAEYLWLAPELLRNPNAEPTQASDVYSFALIMHEITFQKGFFYVKEIHGVKHAFNKLTVSHFQLKFAKCAESDESNDANTDDESCAGEVLKKVKVGTFRPTMPFVKKNPKFLVLETLMVECWHEKFEKRPTFPAVLAKLRKAVETERIDIAFNVGKRLKSVNKNFVRELLCQKARNIDERDKAVKYLTHLMPPSVSYEFLTGEPHVASLYENVTIYFNDIVEFTSIMENRELTDVVLILDDLFKAYDKIIKFYDCFPLHRVGSSLLLASGVPHKNKLHASEVAQPALQIRQFVKEYTRVKIQMKAGLHSGSVMAGIVGKNIPQFGLFGDTVNTASRMASFGNPDEIQISESTRTLLTEIGGFIMSKPEEKVIKGKGKMKTSWLTGYKSYKVIPLGRRLDDMPPPKSSTESKLQYEQQTMRVLPASSMRPSALQSWKESVRLMKSPNPSYSVVDDTLV